MKTLCFSVRLESLIQISDKCFKARAFDGSEALIPSKFVFGRDYAVNKSEAWWIAAWILEKKELQYSSKKKAWFDENGFMSPNVSVKVHNPKKVDAVSNNEIAELER